MTQQPWRRGSTVAQPSQTRRTRSIWADAPSPHRSALPAKSNQSISREGLRMARRDLGGSREQDEFSLLLSPSRGVAEDDPTSLKNPDVQERFRDHIAKKLRKWVRLNPFGTPSPDPTKKREELGIILLDLRKLREGIHSIQRIDAFASEVYETSVLLSLVGSNQAQLLSSLPYLVTVIHPALVRDDVTTSFAKLTVSAYSRDAPSKPCPATRSFYLALYLFHSHLLPALLASPEHSTSAAGGAVTSSAPPLSTFLPVLLSLLSLSSLPHPPSLRPSVYPTPPQQSLPSETDTSIDFILRFHLATIRSSLSVIATLLAALPPLPTSISTHFQSLLSDFPLVRSSKPQSECETSISVPHPFSLVMLMTTTTSTTKTTTTTKDSIVAQLREKFYRTSIEKSFRFPPDSIEWLSRWLLFEFEVGSEFFIMEEERKPPSSKGSSTRESIQDWEQASFEEEEEREETETNQSDRDTTRSNLIKVEAERRVIEYVKLKRGL